MQLCLKALNVIQTSALLSGNSSPKRYLFINLLKNILASSVLLKVGTFFIFSFSNGNFANEIPGNLLRSL